MLPCRFALFLVHLAASFGSEEDFLHGAFDRLQWYGAFLQLLVAVALPLTAAAAIVPTEVVDLP